jgi:hypothetical protein
MAGMKKMICLLFICSIMTACERMKSCDNSARIILGSDPCAQWSIQKDNNIYPADTIPTEYKMQDMEACIQYELYQDTSSCPCCGGIRARIISIGPLPD